ncbi:MAG: hypothetical protein AMXMBFR59_26200 [Rhodanobacteraceae bacterium]
MFALAMATPCITSASGFTASSATTARLGSKVISAGDSMSRVLEAGGEPIRRTDLVNGYGVKVGERWIYMTGNARHTVIEFTTDGTVYGVRDVVGQ